ncbi:MAG TPA: PAS domain S-box protein [Ohtaekwangia sp.]|nr:PAS domain S-box protein [Ohtaekwangia sp.]
MKRELKILLLEDSPDDAELVQRELKNAGLLFNPMVVKKKVEFENALWSFRPDVVLSDHSLPQFNSLEALKLHNAFQRASKVVVPFILVTGAVSEEFAVQCINAGANDFILKDRLKRLPASIENALEKARIENERVKFLEEVLVNQAMMKDAEQLAHVGSWQADLITGHHQWSDECYRIYGYEPGEVPSNYEKFLSHVHPEDLPVFLAGQDEAMRSRDSFELEIRIIDKAGQVKHLETKVRITRDQNGTPIHLVGFNRDITERKNAAHQLQKSEQEYKSLFQQNPDGVYSLDLDGRFTNVNDRIAELTGLSREELLAMDFLPFLDEENAQDIYGHFVEATKGVPQHYEARLINHVGKELILDITNMPIVVDGRIVGVHGVVKDLTEKRQLEILLDRANRVARMGGWEVDLVTGQVNWTALTKEIHEVPPDFIPDIETGISFFKEGANRDAIAEIVRQAKKNGVPWDVELQIITAKNNERWVRVIGAAEVKDGRCVRLYGSFQDIHVRKSAEETLKEAYHEKIGILESIGDAFFAVNREWIVTYWNNIAEKKLGVPKEHILGKNLWDVFADAVPLAFYSNYHKAMNENTAMQFSEYYPRLDIWLQVSVYPSATGLSIYFRDITALVQYTRAIEEQNMKLQEIARVQSHEVRAPLARVMGLVDLLATHNDGTLDQAEILNLITQSANELDGLIRKIVRKAEEIQIPKSEK